MSNNKIKAKTLRKANIYFFKDSQIDIVRSTF